MKVALFTITIANIIIIIGIAIQVEIARRWTEQCDEKFGEGNWVLLPKEVVGLSIAYQCVQKGKEYDFCLNMSDLPNECLKIYNLNVGRE